MSYNNLQKGRYSQFGRAYFITTVTEKRYPWFNELGNARLLVKQLRRVHDDGEVHSLAWVIMPDHLHWLFQLGEVAELSTVIKCLKARTAQDINRRHGRRGSFWQKTFHDHGLRDGEDIRGFARYMVANPLRAGLVENIGDYPHWDAIWLNDKKP